MFSGRKTKNQVKCVFYQMVISARGESKLGKGREVLGICTWRVVGILCRVVTESLAEKVRFE